MFCENGANPCMRCEAAEDNSQDIDSPVDENGQCKTCMLLILNWYKTRTVARWNQFPLPHTPSSPTGYPGHRDVMIITRHVSFLEYLIAPPTHTHTSHTVTICFVVKETGKTSFSWMWLVIICENLKQVYLVNMEDFDTQNLWLMILVIALQYIPYLLSIDIQYNFKLNSDTGDFRNNKAEIFSYFQACPVPAAVSQGSAGLVVTVT